jgi:hypothetical protein
MTLYRDSVAVLRAELIDGPYGQVRSWATARTVYTALRASVQPSRDRGNDADDMPGRETGVTVYRVYTGRQADVRQSDRVRYGGQLYDVVGVSLVWPAVASRQAYTTFTMRRVDG